MEEAPGYGDYAHLWVFRIVPSRFGSLVETLLYQVQGWTDNMPCPHSGCRLTFGTDTIIAFYFYIFTTETPLVTFKGTFSKFKAWSVFIVVYNILLCCICCSWRWLYIDGFVQERRNSSTLAMELRLSCINLSTCSNWKGKQQTYSQTNLRHYFIYS